jgi:hypothetical protein
MLVHALNNAAVVFLTPSSANEAEPTLSPFVVGPVSMAVLAAGFALILLPRTNQR